MGAKLFPINIFTGCEKLEGANRPTLVLRSVGKSWCVTLERECVSHATRFYNKVAEIDGGERKGTIVHYR